MDILAARKKAAEQASAKMKPEPEAAAPAAGPAQDQETPSVSPAAGPAAVSTTAALPPAAADIAMAKETPRPVTETIPASTAGHPEEARQQDIELLSFRLGGEEYAVMVEDVREVLKVVQPTLVPNTPDYILGVTSLRGMMLPIIDLCKRFNLASGAKDDKSRIVVVSSVDEYVGLLVDRVTGVFKIRPSEIKQAPENIEQGAEFLRGIVRNEDRLYILLDLEKAVGA